MDNVMIVGLVLLAANIVLGYKRPPVAFITAPICAVVLVYVAVATEMPDYMVLPPLLVIVTLAAIAVSDRDQVAWHWSQWWARHLLVTIALLLLLAVVLALFQHLGAGFILPLFFVLGVVAVVASPIIYAAVSRRMMVMLVFSTLGSIMRQNLPLAMALDCAVAGREDAAAGILRRVQAWLVKGYSLTEAVRRGYPECPARPLALLAAGEQVDQLPAVLTAIETDLRVNATDRRRLQPVHPFYPVIVLTFAFLVVLALMTFVMPTFHAVLQEMMGSRLPTATRVLLIATDAVVHPKSGWTHLAFLSLFVAAAGLSRLSRRRRPEKPYWYTWLLDSIRWSLPIVRWFERNRALVQVVELLRLSLNAGCPVNEAIRGTLQLDVNLCFRSRLVCWLQQVERGENIAQSARHCGLGAALAWAFEGGAQTGNTPAVLEMLESHYRSNYSYRVNLARFILWPLGIIALGVVVGFVVYAIFSPGVMILREMAGQIYP